MRQQIPIRERLLRNIRVDETTNCWVWLCACQPNGYGKIMIDKKNRLAHRISFEEFVNLIPVGMTIDHKCKTRNCINPSHLEVVTQEENYNRGNKNQNKNKTHCKRGHLLNKENVWTLASGSRACKLCDKLRIRKNKYV